MVKHPPRGYFDQEYPLPHVFQYKFSLQLQDVAQDATICPLFRNSTENTTQIDLIEVNPQNTLFAESNGPTCHKGSIIPRTTVSIKAFLSEASALTFDPLGINKPVMFNWAPIYTSFANSLDAADDRTGLAVSDIMELAKGFFEEVNPLYVADLDNAVGHSSAFPLTTEPSNFVDETFDDWGLGVDTVMEHVAWSKNVYFNHVRFGTNSAMLRKVCPKIHTGVVTAGRPFSHYSNNFTMPSVKRINPFTFCGILFSVPAAGDTEQPILDSEVTDIEHLFFTVRVLFDEWNPNFDQSLATA